MPAPIFVDYQSALEVFQSARDPAKGKPLGNRCRLIGNNNYLAVEHQWSHYVPPPGYETSQYSRPWVLTRDWIPIVRYYPAGHVVLSTCGCSDVNVFHRMSQFSPAMVYWETRWWAHRFVRFEGKDYYWPTQLTIFLPANRRRRPFYGPPATKESRENSDKRLRPGRGCMSREMWEREDTDRTETWRLIDRLRHLITETEMYQSFGYRIANTIEAELVKRERNRAAQRNRDEQRAREETERELAQMRASLPGVTDRAQRVIELERRPCGTREPDTE